MSPIYQKMFKDRKFKKKLFPRKKTKHDMKKRTEEKFLINNIVTERYKRSSIPAMKKMLNEEELKLKRAFQNIDIVTRELCFSNSISAKI